MAETIEIPSERGPVTCAYHSPTADGGAVVLMVGGGDGGLDGPAERIYPTLTDDFAEVGIGALRLDFRIHQFPGDVEQSVHDVQVGLRYLAGEGVERAGLLGHSFGGAVVIEAGVDQGDGEAAVASVATLATQTAGAQRVPLLAPKPVLFVHGLADRRLSPDCSRMLHDAAGEPKRLVLYEDATHSLRQRRDDLRGLLVDWFRNTLAAS